MLHGHLDFCRQKTTTKINLPLSERESLVEALCICYNKNELTEFIGQLWNVDHWWQFRSDVCTSFVFGIVFVDTSFFGRSPYCVAGTEPD